MGGWGLIQVLFIWGIIIFILKKRKSTSSGDGRQAPNTTVTTGGANNHQNNGTMMQKHPQSGHWGQNMQGAKGGGPGMQGGTGGWGRNNTQPAPAPMAQAVTSQAKGRDEEESTTEYLAKKAQEDAREHAKEKWEEEKRLRESRGGLAVAERHLDGDPVPQNKRCVICGYCAAENLVPMTARARYSCYFCREPL